MLRTDVNGRVSFLVSLLVPLSGAIALFLLLYILFLSHLWGDQAFLMYAAKQVLAGVRLDGPQLVETNPPMVVWFSVLPVLLSERLHVLPDFALWSTLILLLAGSTLWCYSLLRRAGLRVSPVILTTLIGLAEFVIRPALFGQKEQIGVALMMPFIIAAATGIDSLSLAERCAIGLCAGLGACFKPHQILVLVALECFLLLLRPSLRRLYRPDVIAAVVAAAAYFFCVWLFTPYLADIVPVLKDTYWALGDQTFLQLLLHEAGPLTAGLIVVCCFIVLLHKKVDIALPGAFAACSVGATIAFYVQHTGWYYQAFPAKAFLTLAALTLLLAWLSSRSSESIVYVKPSAAIWIAAVSVALIAFGGLAISARRASAGSHAATVDSELLALPEGTSVYVFSIEMSQFRVLLDHHLVWGSRFAHLWMMPAIVQNEYSRKDERRPFKKLGAQRTELLATTFRSDTAQDFAHWKPQYVFVEKCEGAFYCSIYNHSINFITWYSQDPAFAAQWAPYRFQKTVGNFDLYARH